MQHNKATFNYVILNDESAGFALDYPPKPKENIIITGVYIVSFGFFDSPVSPRFRGNRVNSLTPLNYSHIG